MFFIEESKSFFFFLKIRPNTVLEGNIAELASRDCLRPMWIKECGPMARGGGLEV